MRAWTPETLQYRESWTRGGPRPWIASANAPEQGRIYRADRNGRMYPVARQATNESMSDVLERAGYRPRIVPRNGCDGPGWLHGGRAYPPGVAEITVWRVKP